MLWLNLSVITLFIVAVFALLIRLIFGCSPLTSIMISSGWLTGGALAACGAVQWMRRRNQWIPEHLKNRS